MYRYWFDGHELYLAMSIGVLGARCLGDFGKYRADLDCVDRNFSFCGPNFSTTRSTPSDATLDNGDRCVGDNDTMVRVGLSQHDDFLRNA